MKTSIDPVLQDIKNFKKEVSKKQIRIINPFWSKFRDFFSKIGLKVQNITIGIFTSRITSIILTLISLISLAYIGYTLYSEYKRMESLVQSQDQRLYQKDQELMQCKADMSTMYVDLNKSLYDCQERLFVTSTPTPTVINTKKR